MKFVYVIGLALLVAFVIAMCSGCTKSDSPRKYKAVQHEAVVFKTE